MTVKTPTVTAFWIPKTWTVTADLMTGPKMRTVMVTSTLTKTSTETVA